jgi:hypothetical protein
VRVRVFRGSWWSTRPALVATGLVLLSGTPAILAAANAANRWVLAGVDGVAGVILVFAAVWQERTAACHA